MEGEIDDSEKIHIKVFTDKNLASYLSQGWDYDGPISGKIKTLHGLELFTTGLPRKLSAN
jgi:hypothetical protein